MILIILPEDIIKRCLWSEYKQFVLKDKSEDEINKIIVDNKPITLNENDAYVIGLLRVIETENLIHRFNVDMNEVLKIKSTIHEVEGDKKVLLSKSSLLKETIAFKNKFPEAYQPDLVYKKAIKELIEYVNTLYKEFDEIDTITVNIKDKNITFVLSNDVKKILKKYNAIPV